MLARALPAFRPRTQQLELALSVQETIDAGGALIAEAGTGTGKTYAYLVPALLSGQRVLLSTGTKTLQDQLFLRDIPLLRRLLKVPVKVALLKGRSNYLCQHHLEQVRAEGRFTDRATAHQFSRIVAFALSTRTGDITQLDEISDQSPLWPRVTSTRDNCLGTQCQHHAACFVLQARRHALTADVVVVNHHLFFADILLQDEDAGELLPRVQTVILDEAHQVPAVARHFFGDSCSTQALLELTQDILNGYVEARLELVTVSPLLQDLDKAARDLRLSVTAREGRWSREGLPDPAAFQEALDQVRNTVQTLLAQLELDAVRADGVLPLLERGRSLRRQLGEWVASASTDSDQWVRWVECHPHSLHLNRTPLQLENCLRPQWQIKERAWVFVSATLSVKGDFSHFQEEIGLQAATCRSWESPFDYARQGLLYVPENLAEPNTPAFIASLIAAAVPVLAASRGRAFLLFTSYRALRTAHQLLRTTAAELGWNYPLLVQGEAARSELLERFRQAGNAILLGTGAFWEGVDIQGEALSLVVIDKIPFAVPDDPVLAARLELLKQQGQNPFWTYQLPHAVIALKQGAGRLIRSEQDRGVLMICDRRLLDKSYGRRIWMSLPPMRRTRALQEVERFWRTASESGVGE